MKGKGGFGYNLIFFSIFLLLFRIHFAHLRDSLHSLSQGGHPQNPRAFHQPPFIEA